MKKLELVAALVALAVGALAYPPWPNTPLDDYVNAPNPSYKWQYVNSIRKFDFTVHNIFLTSQTWLTANDSTCSVWTHWLSICVPDVMLLNEGVGFIYLDGGHTANIASPPSDVDPFSTAVCGIDGMVAAHLSAVPNEPCVFSGDPKHQSRSEDALIAFTWAHFINCPSEPYWLARMPMALAGVTGMTAMAEFTAQFSGIVPLTKFVVSGASKRGWDTWMVGAVDPRVIGIVPLVSPIGTLVPQINQMWQSYGDWSFAIDDYNQEGLMQYLNEPIFQQMLDLIAIDGYYERLTMPKLAIDDIMDEFFMPNGFDLFWPNLPHPKIHRTLANAEHSMSGHQVDMFLSDVSGWIVDVARGRPLPNMISWASPDGTQLWAQVVPEGSMALVKPSKAIVWYYTNPTTRDFRWIRCANITDPACLHIYLMDFKELDDIGNYTYTVTMPIPQTGWTIFMIEIEFTDTGGVNQLDPLKITSQVSIIPQTYPYAPCSAEVCQVPPPQNNCSFSAAASKPL